MNKEDIRRAIIYCVNNGKSTKESIIKILFSSFPKELILPNLEFITELIERTLLSPKEGNIEDLLAHTDFRILGSKPRTNWISKVSAVLEGRKPTLRFAPNPSGPLHLGHSRIILLNQIVAEELSGEYFLRIEDTDPERVSLSATEEILNISNILRINYARIDYQSERVDVYKRYVALIKHKVFVCTCTPAEMQLQRKNFQICEHIHQNTEEIFQDFYRGGIQGILRVLTGQQKTPSFFDIPIARIKGNKVCFMMNFAVSVDDFDMGINLVLRGEDHVSNEPKQALFRRWFSDALSIEEPFIHYFYLGKVTYNNTSISTTKINLGILPKVLFLKEYLEKGDLQSLKLFWNETGLSRSAISIPQKLLSNII